MKAALFMITASFLFSESKLSSTVGSHQRLLRDLFAMHDGDGRPSSDESSAVLVHFGAKLVRIINLNERGNSIQSQWWIQQRWKNSELSWNEKEYNNTKIVHVNPKRVWAPDILLYNSADENNKLSGGTEKYKTKIAIYSNGSCTWLAPAMFHSTCDINTEYFPFDDQLCILKFGSWAFDGSEMDVKVDELQTGLKKGIYQENNEWQMINVTASREEKNYSCCPHAYPRVIIRVRLRRRYVFYMVNLVVPCSLIALMVLLSFILPPESGERIGLGITVLMAMAIFQELTSAKLPVDSENMPLLAKYYSSAITEIGLALFATCVILNFHYRRTPMSKRLKKLFFTYLGPAVRIEYKVTRKSRRTRRLLSTEEDQEPAGNYHGRNCEMRKPSVKNCDSSLKHNEVDEQIPLQRARAKTRSTIRETPKVHTRRDDHSEICVFQPEVEPRDDEHVNFNKDWQLAAKILDRLVLVLATFISFSTFVCIFIQAPRVQEMFWYS